VNKEEVDKYFTDNWSDIQSIVKANSNKCVTKNQIDITSYIYEVCISKAATINNIRSFICLVAANIYRHKNSQFNRENRILVENDEFIDTYNEEGYVDVNENRSYALKKYYLNGEPHEQRLYELYVIEGVTTIDGMRKRLGVTYYAAQILINEFKQKIKNYEREI
jgi:hypothetical protein